MEIVTLAFVLRSVNFREADRMLTLFSREYGQISALAKNCRTQKSKLRPATELFVCAEFTLYKKSDRFYVSGASIRQSFFGVRGDIESLCVASIMSDALCRVVQPSQPEREAFLILAHCLYALDIKRDPKAVFCFFSIKLLGAMGIGPVFEACVRCGGVRGDRFSFADNGMLCCECRGGTAISDDTVNYLLQIQRSRLADCGKTLPSRNAPLICRKLLQNCFNADLHGMDMFFSMTVLNN